MAAGCLSISCSDDDADSRWDLRCETQADCRDGDLCLEGTCTPGGADVDGGPSDEDGSDSGFVDPYDCQAHGTCCGSTLQDMVMDPGVGDAPVGTRAITWQVHNGVDLELDTSHLGTWLGTRMLDEPMAVECPSNADQLGLPCQIDRVVQFRHKDGRLVEFRVGLPAEALEAIPSDITVEIDHLQDIFDGVTYRVAVRRKPSDEVLLVIDGYSGSGDELRLDYPTFSVYLQGELGDYGSAHCMVPADRCQRVLRVDDLHIDADATHALPPGHTRDFSAGGASYRAWHVVSTRRVYGEWGGCTDLTPPHASFAIVATDTAQP
ncbi:hypothetical protein FIV42_21865 [Persicimonas caeni]|uniref:Uncharacterized protein n=1 Tax=Persicimonas caeni TaxID=2292766 RepID=A0A4Y6PY87_PERCE|nr:hypothetical protein [Persicimonas caeni]QDG53294.1 hypothetical protein FIV42_21865 [Persicimonas caeni]QED34516.1 hypothetical protein FRD00_21860 [Persicimonas caeni]